MINQINIVVDKEKDIVTGYSNIGIENIFQITNGYVNNIVFTTIDKVDQENRNKIFMELCKKLNHGGSITVKFLNPDALAHKIKNGSLSSEGFSSLVNDLRSSWMESDFLGFVSGLNGFNLLKHIHEDVYSIAVIEKSK
jgi:hypothetical protein